MTIRFTNVYVAAAVGLAALFLTSCAGTGIRVSEARRDGWRTVVLENGLYRTVLVPELARFPLSYTFKATGHELFAQPVSLDRPPDGFQSYGGCVDSLPWVSGRAQGKRLPKKGYLHKADWLCETGRNSTSAWFQGEAVIEYPDPLDGRVSRLRYTKRVTGFAGCSVLRMDHAIENVGDDVARFTFCNHARTAIGGRDRGDYVYAPGSRCFLYYMNDDVLAARGLKPPCWAPWPLRRVVEFDPGEAAHNAFVFVPANWCAAGDDRSGVVLFFIAGPVNHAGRPAEMKMGLYMTNAQYLLEPSLTCSIVGSAEEWSVRGATVSLEPGQRSSFVVYLAVYQGITREAVTRAVAVHAECVVLRPPVLTDRGPLRFSGEIAVPGDGLLEIRAGDKVIRSHAVRQKIVDLDVLGVVPAPRDRELSLTLRTALGERVLWPSEGEGARGTHAP